MCQYDRVMRDDLKAAFRSLRSSKDVALAALIVLTLGIGATTAIFSVVDAVVLRALPFDEHDRLVAVGERRAPGSRSGSSTREPDALGFVAPQNYMDWAAQQQVFESIAAVASGWLTLHEPGVEPESLVPQRVTAQFFDVLRVPPAIGRVFAAENEVFGRDRVAVLSDALWRRRFGGDPQIVGRTIPLDDVEGGEGRYEVLGVMPPGFAYPVGVNRPTDIWIPYVVPADQRIRNPASRSIYLQVIARLKPGVSLAAAQAQMDQIAAALETANPQWNKDSRIGVRPLIDHVVGSSTKSWMLMLLGSVGIVLLIACANVANLLLARATAREREIGIRAALGASRSRLVRQLMIESLLLSTLGTVCAIVIGWWAVEILRNAMPESLPRVTAIALNMRVLAAAAGLSLITGVLFGAVPALQSSRPDVSTALKDGGRSSASVARQRLRAALVIAEVALAVVLLVGAAVFIGSFVSVMRIDLGFSPENVLTAQISPPFQLRGVVVRPTNRAPAFAEIVERIQSESGSPQRVDGGRAAQREQHHLDERDDSRQAGPNGRRVDRYNEGDAGLSQRFEDSASPRTDSSRRPIARAPHPSRSSMRVRRRSISPARIRSDERLGSTGTPEQSLGLSATSTNPASRWRLGRKRTSRWSRVSSSAASW